MKMGLTLMEERFCQLVALGKTAREAYSEAYSVAVTDRRREHAVDNRASRLMKRPDVAARIAEAAGEQRRRNREMWERRGEEIADGIYDAIRQSLGRVDKDGRPRILERDTLKGVEVLARLKGLNAPEETVLKNGGVSDDYVPRGVEGMSADDLRAIIEMSERTVEAESVEAVPGAEGRA